MSTDAVVLPGDGGGDDSGNTGSDCHCTSTDNNCTTCSSTSESGKFCAPLDFAVYTDCVSGAVTGNGYFPSCDPLRVGLRDHMQRDARSRNLHGLVVERNLHN